MKQLICGMVLVAWTAVAAALEVSNLTDEMHVSGPKLKPADLEGKVVVVEAFGLTCPPCRAVLPHIGELARKLGGKPAVVIGTHLWQRNDEAVRELLKRSKCNYSVYQQFAVAGSPRINGVPYAMIFDHKGQLFWGGHPANKDFDAKVMEAVKAVPVRRTAGVSLADGLELKYCKDLTRRLMVGQNIEPALEILRQRVQRGGAAGEEAQALLEQSTAWIEQAEEEIRETLVGTPSKALLLAKTFSRTVPSRAAEFKEAIALAAKNTATTRLAASRQTLEKLRQTAAKSAAARRALLAKVQMQLKQLGLQSEAALDTDFQDVKAQWEAFAAELSQD